MSAGDAAHEAGRPVATGLTLGVDIGGTKVMLALVDAAGQVVERARIATPPGCGAACVVGEVAAVARESFAAHWSAVRAVGVAVAGQVGRAGVVLGAPNLQWTNVPLRVELRRALGLPALVVNDVRAAAWAEWLFGAGQACADLVVLFLGTGVGGAAISGGRLLHGSGNLFGEFGHMTLVAGGRACHCRNAGCLEAYASGWAIADRARLAVRAAPEAGAALLARAGVADAITTHDVAEASRGGDRLAVRLVEETGEYLGAGAVSLVNALNPRRLILGGGVIDGFPELVAIAARVVAARALPASAREVELLPAALGNHAPVIGAAVMAHARLAARTARGTTVARRPAP